MNAIEDNPWSRGFRSLGRALPRPRAILAVSAHWYVKGVFLTGSERPETIHDFGGFPEELYAIEYPAPGDGALAGRASLLLARWGASVTDAWGLDHGTWSVLRHMWPEADVPVVQLSIDARLPAGDHLEIGRALAPLRDEGVLVLGSGNLVHDLGDAFRRMRAGDRTTPPWAGRFDGGIAEALERHDHDFLARAPGTPDGRRAHPTSDHYLPLLYAAGASDADGRVEFPIVGFDMGSLSMRSVVMG